MKRVMLSLAVVLAVRPGTAPASPIAGTVPRGPVDILAPSEDIPSEEEVWNKVPRLRGGRPPGDVTRNNVRIQVEKLAPKAGPCQDHPILGRRQLVHRNYKCTVSFDEWSWPAWAVHRVEVVYIDRSYYRPCRHTHATP